MSSLNTKIIINIIITIIAIIIVIIVIISYHIISISYEQNVVVTCRNKRIKLPKLGGRMGRIVDKLAEY